MTEKKVVTFDNQILDYISLGEGIPIKPLLNEELCKATDNWGTLLHYAAFYTDLECVQDFIKLGSDVDALNRDGKTPLMIALENDLPLLSTPVVDRLLSANANMHIIGPCGLSALQMLFRLREVSRDLLQKFFRKLQTETSRYDEFIQKLIAAGCTLYHAVCGKDPRIFDALLERGFDVNSRDLFNRTALMAAAYENDLDSVKMLLDKGADVNALDYGGLSALLIHEHSPLIARKDAIFYLLLEHGADVNMKTRKHGLTLLSYYYLLRTINYAEQLDTYTETLFLYDVIPQNTTHLEILDIAYRNNSSYRKNLLVSYLAMLDLMGIPIIQSLTASTVTEYRTRYPDFGRYHDLCQRILTMPMLKSLTLLDLLEASESKMRIHVRNVNLLPKLAQFYLEHNLAEQCPLYIKKLEKRISKATRLLELENKAIPIISKIFDDNCDIVAREVVGYLNERDLQQLCQLQE